MVKMASAIELKFPRIAEVLCEYWGKKEYGPYIQSLIFDHRGGRQGFPDDVAEELMLLHSLGNRSVSTDVWDSIVLSARA